MLQLQIFAHALRRNWWIVLLTVISAVVAVLAFDLTRSPLYRTTSRLLVVPNQTVYEGRDLIYGLDSLNTRSIVYTYVEIANSRYIYNQAVSALNLEPGERTQYTRSAVVLPNANVIEITVEGPNLEIVASLANAISRETSDFIRETYDIYRLNILDQAGIPLRPISPTPARHALLAAVLGLVFGAVLAVVRNQIEQPLRRTVRQWQTIDKVSSVFTRSHFENRLEQLISSNGESLALGLIQLEGLCELRLPTPIMKQLLHQVTTKLRHDLRGRDIIGRWNDYSFALLMPDITPADATQTLERIQYNLSQPVELYEGGEKLLLQPRTGAIVSEGSQSSSLLIEQVETALMHANMNGSKPVMYSPEMAADSV